jgi:ATPase subunit of ABC transporter with duplicated ATPase domains
VTSILLSRVSFSHSDSVPLIVDLDLQIDTGWTGVVGPNGAGKTTLLELLAGDREPDTGSVRFHPPALRRLLCPQTVDRCTPEVSLLAKASEGEARRIRGQLGLEPHELERWSGLSPGERKRWQVGAALSSDPDLLLLDEPTNHLDADARSRLIAALRGFRGIGIVVSHDRTLLDALTTRTIRFDHGGIRCWRGSYAGARVDWEREEREQLAAYQKLQSEKKKLRRRLADTRQKRAVAEGRMRTSKRMKSARDADARGRFKAKRRRSAEVGLGRETHKLRGKLDRIAEQARAFDFYKTLGRSLAVDYVPSPAPRLMSLEIDELCAGDAVLLREVQVQVARESRIHVAGPNGAGKTTLVGRLMGALRVPASRVLYLPQELTPSRELALLEELRESAAPEQGRVLSIVAALGVDPEALLASARPSPGEARKLALAFGLARQVWALVVDEPTNHLDLPSIERIEAALADYPGALVIVTHDEAFARRCTDTVWELRDGRIRVSSGGEDAPPRSE